MLNTYRLCAVIIAVVTYMIIEILAILGCYAGDIGN
jgi:hypothetical protein